MQLKQSKPAKVVLVGILKAAYFYRPRNHSQKKSNNIILVILMIDY